MLRRFHEINNFSKSINDLQLVRVSYILILLYSAICWLCPAIWRKYNNYAVEMKNDDDLTSSSSFISDECCFIINCNLDEQLGKFQSLLDHIASILLHILYETYVCICCTTSETLYKIIIFFDLTTGRYWNSYFSRIPISHN